MAKHSLARSRYLSHHPLRERRAARGLPAVARVLAVTVGIVGCLTACCLDPAVEARPQLPKSVATADRPAVSPSGEYMLMVVRGNDGAADFVSFRIDRRNSDSGGVAAQPRYVSDDRFTARHTTYFLWDDDDRVWVYSGDVGTVIWQRDAESSTWTKRPYEPGVDEVPEFLRQTRPEQFSD